MKKRILLAVFLVAMPATAQRVPPIGLQLAAGDQAALQEGVVQLEKQIARLPSAGSLAPDVRIFHKAVDWAIRHQEFYRSNEIQIAYKLIQQGLERARALAEGRAP